MRFLVTGFGPFLSHAENPSALIATACGEPHEILEVSYRAVEAFMAQLDPNRFDALLMLGLAANAERLRFELVGRNACESIPDVEDVVYGPGPIDPSMPDQLASTLWPAVLLNLDPERIETSTDAGGYLCNFALFTALIRFPEKAVGFMHVVSEDVQPIDDQVEIIKAVIDGIRSNSRDFVGQF